jgi:hypothetical protein
VWLQASWRFCLERLEQCMQGEPPRGLVREHGKAARLPNGALRTSEGAMAQVPRVVVAPCAGTTRRSNSLPLAATKITSLDDLLRARADM